jgi:hypothetical protein
MLQLGRDTYLLNTAHFEKLTRPPLREAQQGLEKFIVMITRAWPARVIYLLSS